MHRAGDNRFRFWRWKNLLLSSWTDVGDVPDARVPERALRQVREAWPQGSAVFNIGAGATTTLRFGFARVGWLGLVLGDSVIAGNHLGVVHLFPATGTHAAWLRRILRGMERFLPSFVSGRNHVVHDLDDAVRRLAGCLAGGPVEWTVDELQTLVERFVRTLPVDSSTDAASATPTEREAKLVYDVIVHWMWTGMRPRPRADAEELEHVESLLCAPLPAAARAIYEEANGFVIEMDDRCMTFWPAARIVSETRVAEGKDERGLYRDVAFADFLIDSWTFRYRVRLNGEVTVFVEGTGDEMPFGEFLDRYLHDPDSIGLLVDVTTDWDEAHEPSDDELFDPDGAKA